MSDQEQPKKISPDRVEVIDREGHVVQEAQDKPARETGFGGIRVMHAGPLALLLVPLLLPILLIAMVVLMIFALVFGRGVFRVIRWRR